MTTLIAVPPAGNAGDPWLAALAAADCALLGRATCDTMVQQVAAFAPQQLVIQARRGPPPCIQAASGSTCAWRV